MRTLLISIAVVLTLGLMSGWVAGPVESNAWYATLRRPALQPPGFVFGIAWTILYVLIGAAIGRIVNAPRHAQKPRAIAWFVVQLALNLFWSTLFFRLHMVAAAFHLIVAILLAALWTTLLFHRIDRTAARLMVPYLAWLCFAAGLAWRVWQLNPGA